MNDSHAHSPDGDPTFWERPGTIRGVTRLIVFSCIVLVLAEFAYEHHHPHFALETSFAFQAWLGFVAFVAAVFLGRGLRWAVERRPEYYDANPDEPRWDIDPDLTSPHATSASKTNLSSSTEARS
ncbi:MAG: hypothetical protein AAF958_00715 [Planctomycetota bacterium]